MNKNKAPTLLEVKEHVKKMQAVRKDSPVSRMSAKAARALLAEIMPSK
jgi:hypothetical protein